jgi:glycosyltransferase involved in cell wall biosynthesis
VIDEIHGIPFFTPFYVTQKKIALICEVAGRIWDITFPFPFNLAGRMVERVYPFFYKGIPVATISESSKNALKNIGFSEKRISVLNLGCRVPVIKRNPRKNSDPTLVFISRITKSKGIEDAIYSVSEVKKTFKNVKLLIIGRGEKEYIERLKELISELSLLKTVKFMGFVEEKEKWRILESSHILIVPSVQEGWGLTVHEAGARGTPSIVYNVEGLRDVVKDGKSGIICQENDYKNLAFNVISLLSDNNKYARLQKGAIEEREKFTWENTVNEFLTLIE